MQEQAKVGANSASLALELLALEELEVNLPEDASDAQLFHQFYRLLSLELRLIRLRRSNPFDEPLGTLKTLPL